MILHSNVDIVDSSLPPGQLDINRSIAGLIPYSYKGLLASSLPADKFQMSSKMLHDLLTSKLLMVDENSGPVTDVQTAAAGIYSHSFITGGSCIGLLSSIYVPDNIGAGMFTIGASGANAFLQVRAIPVATFNQNSSEGAVLILFYNVVNSKPYPVVLVPSVGTPLVVSGALPTGQVITTSLINAPSEVAVSLLNSTMAFKIDSNRLARALGGRYGR